MLNTFPISLSQVKAGNNSEQLKMKLGNYCILVQIKKNYKKYLQKFD